MTMSSAVAFSSFTSLSLRSFRFSSSSFFPSPSFLTQTLTLRPSPLHLPDMNVPLASSFYCDGTPSPLDDIDEEELEALIASISSDKMPPETEEEITAAYEKRYGPAYSGVSVLGNDIFVMDAKLKKNVTSLGRRIHVKVDDGFEERVVEVRRVSKVVKGGKRMSFRVVVAVGNKAGMVGVGVGKAKEVVDAIAKSAANARKNVVTVPMTKHMTFPHRSDGDYGAAKVMLRPACPGTGVRAGGAVRHVLEMAGVKDALGKQLGSDNPLNNARATLMAVMKMRTFKEVALERGIPIEQLWR